MNVPYSFAFMENLRNTFGLIEIGDSARRQYINALSIFTALEEARKKAAQYRGGMYWKTHGKTQIDYLIRTQTDNSQKSIGCRSGETESIYAKFTSSKTAIESRIRDLLRIPAHTGHHSGGIAATVPTGLQPVFRFDCGHHSGAFRPVQNESVVAG